MMPEPCVKITYRYWKKLTYYKKNKQYKLHLLFLE